MSDTTELEQRLAAASPAVDEAEQRLAAMVAARLFGPAHAEPARIGRFTLIERIGRGGMGDVYAAYDPLLDRRVALKLLRVDVGVDRDGVLLREARAAARLAHPNVVAIHDVGELPGGEVYVAMEYIEGPTLRAWLSSRPSFAAILGVFVDVGRGLAAAHDAGVVHRDFKPDNVLISRAVGVEVRGRVVDFGLARLAVGRAADGPTNAAVGASARMGTPAYMAPEQFLGLPVDGRSDQFGFCVALHEALAGRHPFGADEPGATAEQIAGRILGGAAPLGERAVPAWLRRILRRGMMIEPAARHPSMHALVRELEATPARRRRRALLVGAAALAVVSSALTAAGRGEWVRSACAGVEDELRGVWDERRRAASRAAFVATGLANAEEVWQRLAPRLDDYAHSWIDARRRTCEDLRGERRESSLLRGVCLDRRRAELGSLTALFGAPDPATVLSAIGAVEQLTPIAVCEDVEGMRREVALAEPLGEIVAVEGIRREILELAGRARAGHHQEVAPRVAALTSAARGRGGPIVLAEALLLRGLVEEQGGDPDAAAASVEAAVHEAIAGRHERLHAEAAVRLVWLHGVQRRRVAEATAWVAHAEAAVRAIRDDAMLRARLLDHRGAIASSELDFPTAERLHREALGLRATAAVPAPVDLAMSMSGLGLALLSQGRLAEAEPMIEAALTRYADAFGPNHPTVAAVLSNLGQAHVNAGRYDRGVTLLREALRRKERALGAEHVALLSTLTNLGNACSGLGRGAEAREHYLRGLAIGERAFGPESPQIEALLHNLAFEAWQAGAHDEVLRHAGRALAIQRRVYGESHPILAPTLELLARSYFELERRDEAVATIERAVLLADDSLEPRVRGEILLSAAWIGRAAGGAPAVVRRRAHDAGVLLRTGPGPDAERERELAALLAP